MGNSMNELAVQFAGVAPTFESKVIERLKLLSAKLKG
jgi:hypothetical protein